MIFKNKRGLSGIITAVIMIALVMAAAVIVWGVVNGTLKKQMEGAESCFGNFDKVTLNGIYTCYNTVNKQFQFSISIGDIDVEKVVVGISAEGDQRSYTLTEEDQQDMGLTRYGSETEVKIPGKNGGYTYIVDEEFDEVPDLIQIAPVIDGQQCEVSDYISNIGSC